MKLNRAAALIAATLLTAATIAATVKGLRARLRKARKLVKATPLQGEGAQAGEGEEAKGAQAGRHG